MAQTKRPPLYEVPGGPTAVYRLYDSDSQLLYVGVSNNLANRFRWHAREKAWWPQITFRTIVWHETRLGALSEEASAIGYESPEFNVMRKGGSLGVLPGVSRRQHWQGLLRRAQADPAGIAEMDSPKRHFPAVAICCWGMRTKGWPILRIEFPTLPMLAALGVEHVDTGTELAEYGTMAHDRVAKHLDVPLGSITVSVHFEWIERG